MRLRDSHMDALKVFPHSVGSFGTMGVGLTGLTGTAGQRFFAESRR